MLNDDDDKASPLQNYLWQSITIILTIILTKVLIKDYKIHNETLLFTDLLIYRILIILIPTKILYLSTLST